MEEKTFRRLLEGAALSGTKTAERRKINFHKAKRPENGFVTLTQPGTGKTPASASAAKAQSLAEDAHLPLPDSGLYPDSKIRQLITWKRVNRAGPGLHNLGNTCFLNSTLQCLAYLPPFAQFFLSKLSPALPTLPHQQTHFKSQGQLKPRGPVNWLKMLEDFVAEVHGRQGKQHTGMGAISPKAIVSHLKALNRQFRVGRQEDAHELLIHLIEALHSNCLRAAKLKTNAPNRLAETTFVNRIFGGYLRSQVKCTRCGHCSNTYDSFLDLSLEIHGKVGTLDEALARFTAVETLDKANRYRCSKCKELVCAKKQLTIYKPPNVCIVQFKRFMFGSRSSKVSKPISYPDELRLRTSGPDKTCTYRLSGVLVHQGHCVNAGHYYSFNKAANGMWYLFDDSRVAQVTKETALRQHAYLLFYIKVVATPPPTPAPAPAPVPAPAPPLVQATPTQSKTPTAVKTEPQQEQDKANRLPMTPPAPTAKLAGGWGTVLAQAATEGVDPEADIAAHDADEAWVQPQGVASFVASWRAQHDVSKTEVGVSVQRQQDHNKASTSATPSEPASRVAASSPSPAKSESSSDSSSWASAQDGQAGGSPSAHRLRSPPSPEAESVYADPHQLGQVIWGFHYAANVPFGNRYNGRARWGRVFDPRRTAAEEEEEDTRSQQVEKALLARKRLLEEQEAKKATGQLLIAPDTDDSQGESSEEEEDGTTEEEEEEEGGGDESEEDEEESEEEHEAVRRGGAGASAGPVGKRPRETAEGGEEAGRKKTRGPQGAGSGSGGRGGDVRGEGQVLVVRRKKGSEERGFNLQDLVQHKAAPLGDLVGQWGDGDVEGGDDVALAREARDKLTRKLEAQREDERNKRKLSDFASAQISGKKKKVKSKQAEDEEELLGAKNPFQKRQQEMVRGRGGFNGGRGGQHDHRGGRGGFRGGFRGAPRGGGFRGGRGGFQGRGRFGGGQRGGGGFRGRGGFRGGRN